MTIILSILGIHLVNVFFVFFSLTHAVTKCGIKNAYNIRFLFWLFCHPIRNCLALIAIFINGEEEFIKISENRIKESA